MPGELVGSSPKSPGIWGVEVEPLLMITGLQVAETLSTKWGHRALWSPKPFWRCMSGLEGVLSSDQRGLESVEACDTSPRMVQMGTALNSTAQGSWNPTPWALPWPLTAFLIVFKISVFPNTIPTCYFWSPK